MNVLAVLLKNKILLLIHFQQCPQPITKVITGANIKNVTVVNITPNHYHHITLLMIPMIITQLNTGIYTHAHVEQNKKRILQVMSLTIIQPDQIQLITGMLINIVQLVHTQR